MEDVPTPEGYIINDYRLIVPFPGWHYCLPGIIFVYNIAFLLYNYGKELEGRHYQCSKLLIGAKENWR